jgi:hypothetical protein
MAPQPNAIGLASDERKETTNGKEAKREFVVSLDSLDLLVGQPYSGAV